MAGTTNFLQWNPGKANQQSDATYSGDSQRSGGAATTALLPSPLFNKLEYQLSTFVAAFAQMLANKGYTTSDASLSALVTVLSNVRTNADVTPPLVTLSYASSMLFDALVAMAFETTLTGNVASSTLSNVYAGEILTFIFIQDNVGGRTFSWPTNVSGAGTVCPIAGSISIQQFETFADLSVHALAPITVIVPGGPILSSGAAVVSVSTTGTVSNGYPEIFEKVSAAGGAVTRTLYSASGYPSGLKVNVKKVDPSGNTVTISGPIDGMTSVALTRQNDALTFVWDSVTASWSIF